MKVFKNKLDKNVSFHLLRQFIFFLELISIKIINNNKDFLNISIIQQCKECDLIKFILL
jgi:hypothetical protein